MLPVLLFRGIVPADDPALHNMPVAAIRVVIRGRNLNVLQDVGGRVSVVMPPPRGQRAAG